MIQLDCLEVVETMRQDCFPATTGVPFYDECNVLWQEFDSIPIKHCNEVAHQLARVANETPSFRMVSARKSNGQLSTIRHIIYNNHYIKLGNNLCLLQNA